MSPYAWSSTGPTSMSPLDGLGIEAMSTAAVYGPGMPGF
jgi:hypothetical protein